MPKRFITPEVRRERVLVLMRDAGFENLQQLADHMGVHRGWLVKALEAKGVTAKSITMLAEALECSTKLLLER